MEESRRGARVATTFLVAIEGIDREPTARKGDISATGAYFETSRNVGGVGTIHWLYLVSADRARTLRVMAYVVRTMQVDAGKQRVGGVAFEFMPDSDEAAAKVHAFVRYVLALRRLADDANEPHIQPRVDASVGDEGAQATLRQLSVRSMMLETSWAIKPGEKVRVDIVAPGMTRRIRLDGRAVRIAKHDAASKTWDIEVEVQQETDRPLRTNSSMTMKAVRPEEHPSPQPSRPDDDEVTQALDDLLSALILPPEGEAKKKRVHGLSGDLASIKLPTLLSLFDMERMTGKLVLARNGEQSSVWFREGQIVDVAPLAPGEERRARLSRLVEWDDGTFELSAEPVTIPNRFGIGTTALLLDLAREADERSRAT